MKYFPILFCFLTALGCTSARIVTGPDGNRLIIIAGPNAGRRMERAGEICYKGYAIKQSDDSSLSIRCTFGEIESIPGPDDLKHPNLAPVEVQTETRLAPSPKESAVQNRKVLDHNNIQRGCYRDDSGVWVKGSCEIGGDPR